MRVVFAPEVEEDLYGLIKILVEKEYLGTYPFAISYVEELIADIQQNIHSKLKKKAPAFFERYGKDMYYITYQRNSNTTWYIFFSVIGDTYFIKYITNNHVSGQYIFLAYFNEHTRHWNPRLCGFQSRCCPKGTS